MRKFSVFFLGFGSVLYSQNTYIDPTVAAAMIMYSDNLKSKQNQVINETSKLKDAQVWVGSQMSVANNIQNNILKGLKEVSGALQNGIQVQEIYSELNKCYNYSSQIVQLASTNPQYVIFGTRASQKTYEQSLKIATDVSDIIGSGELNLATAGDRYKILYNVASNVKNLKLWLLAIKLRLEKANRVGFWNSINPFAGYINTDKGIVENIMNRYKRNF
ncbi:hypothetical protein D1631_05365 [Chryseobacterium nematophagum]|uniref:Plasmid transfer protein n=1 Tax=Chryseobacterium nematophagum TaxID=2305228 RepID=A0A3M7TMC8_9FLAO|nr:hypothetical protein [Chryseobacterium nematophagum]RNA63749.1 hypothetical protein D1631_05365 [Chryseobacterium nematophagum]